MSSLFPRASASISTEDGGEDRQAHEGGLGAAAVDQRRQHRAADHAGDQHRGQERAGGLFGDTGRLEQGLLTAIEQGGSADAQIRLTLASDDLVKLVDGELNTASAWATGCARWSLIRVDRS